MQLGLSLPNFGPFGTLDTLGRLVESAEAHGFTTAFVSDHIVFFDDLESKYPYSKTGAFPLPPTAPYLEPLAALAVLVGRTTRLRLGTSVLILPYRNPLFTAKFFSSLDQLSGGRLILGAGSGWMEEEFDALGMPFRKRGKTTDEWLEIFRACFTEELPSYAGEMYSFKPLRFEPKPVQDPMPIWVGGHVPWALRRVARYATGWHATYRPNDELQDLLGDLSAACEKEGRALDELELSVRGPMSLAAEARGRFRGPPEHLVESLQALAALGFDHYVIDLIPTDLDATCDMLAQIATEVIPHI